MAEEDISQEFRLKEIDETKKNIEEINQIEFVNNKHKEVCKTCLY